MVRTALLILLGALLATLGACGDDGPSAPPTPTAGDLYLPSTFYQPRPNPTVTPRPIAPRTPVPPPGEWDERSVWADYDSDGRVYDACYGQQGIDCQVEVAAETGMRPETIAFIEANEWVLVSFEELGSVDFGQIRHLYVNMSRPEPVLLNGDFSLIRYREVIPDDWSQADESYGGLPDFPVKATAPWGAISRVAEAYQNDGSEQLVIETLIKFCGPCPNYGFLPLRLTFDSTGALVATEVLPMRCESRAFDWIEIQEGPCVAR
jgi:hypothetical protein